MLIRALIVDDEPLARRSIRRFLRDSSDIEVVGECGDGESAVTAIRDQKPDLVFLDVQLPELSGLDVVRLVGASIMPVTIFVTAYDRYAVTAFDANAIDYLLKPFGRERFTRALTRARERLAGKVNVEQMRLALATLHGIQPAPYLERLAATESGRIRFVSVDDIDWIEADGNYVRVHAGTRALLIRETLTNLERQLNPRRFVRIHRSTIVNIGRISEIQPWFHGHHLVILHTGKQLRMSRYQRAAVKQLGL
jgi:two-component system LytT family response regulator